MIKHKILFLESFYSGSHKAFADGLVKNSSFQIDLLTMSARFWKWRMKGAALNFTEQIKNIEEYKLIFATDLINISDLKSFLGSQCPPIIVYYHENQLAYPLNKNEKLDYHYGLTDLTNCLSADCIIFNSKTHKSVFLDELPIFLNHLPDYVPDWTIEKIKTKSLVIYPGIDNTVLNQKYKESIDKGNNIPLIIWNHRWEFDKNPEAFFKVLFKLKEEKIEFRLALLGEKYKRQPLVFKVAEKKLKDNIVHSGYVEDYSEYIEILKKGDIVISTANQENYGIAVIEAILAGCMPLLPNRLSYPELIPSEFHSECLYSSYKELERKIKINLNDYKDFKQNVLIGNMSKLCWNNIIKDYDNLFESFAIRGFCDVY